jgi:hypothetical protein
MDSFTYFKVLVVDQCIATRIDVAARRAVFRVQLCFETKVSTPAKLGGIFLVVSSKRSRVASPGKPNHDQTAYTG